jgi:hypothetical protein
MDEPLVDASHPVLRDLEAGEAIEAVVHAPTASIVLTDRRVAVAERHRLALSVGYDGVRRIQFDIERQRPATLVIVPEDPRHEPQVIAVPRDRYPDVARALVLIGVRIYDLTHPGDDGRSAGIRAG